MTDADTQVGSANPIVTLIAGAGLVPEPGVVDADGLAAVAGPLLVTELLDGGGQLVGVVAVVDGPGDGQAAQSENLLQALAEAAASEASAAVPGVMAQPGTPVPGGGDLAALFTTPVTVAAFGDGALVRALVVTALDRRGGAASAAAAPSAAAPAGGIPLAEGEDPLGKLVNVSLDVSVELGRTRVTLAEVLDYDVGSVIELDRAAGAPVDIRVNDTLLAQGEVVLIDDEYAVRITAILDPNKRV